MITVKGQAVITRPYSVDLDMTASEFMSMTIEQQNQLLQLKVSINNFKDHNEFDEYQVDEII